MASTAIRVRALEKRYGRLHALRGIDLDVERGEVFGFLGPNGSGKTTTIRILLDLLRPTAGLVEVLGVPPAAGPRYRDEVGYLPGELRLPDGATAGEYVGYLCSLRGGRGADAVAPLAERFGLGLNRTIRELSKGNKQKVGVIQAFMHAPDLLVLDEPTAGLDPLLQRSFLELVREHAGRGAAVFMSSHVLKEVEEAAGRVAILREGRLLDTETVHTLRRRAGQDVVLQFAHPVTPSEFDHLPGVQHASVQGTELRCTVSGEPDALLKAAARHHVVRWHAKDRELEDLFLEVYRLDPAAGQPVADGGRSKRRRARHTHGGSAR